MHGGGVLELNSHNRAFEPADDKSKADRHLREAAVDPHEYGGSSADEVTLDDLGGRSDALGG
jgi:hypothetical protein